MAKVSVIVPIYAVEATLRQCIESVLAQTIKDLELILVDDGGNDSCPQICDEYAKKDARVKVIHKQNGGMGSANNVGLAQASGEWIGFVEPDDWIEETMYDELLSHALSTGAGVAKGGYAAHYEDGTVVNETFASFETDGVFTLEERPWPLQRHPSYWTCIYKKNLLEEAKIRFEEVPAGGWVDNLFQLKTLALIGRSGGLCCVPRPLYHYRAKHYEPLVRKLDWERMRNCCINMNAWAGENGFGSPHVLASLYWKEFHYLYFISQTAPKCGLSVAANAIKAVVDEWDPLAFGVSRTLTRLHRNLYWQYRHIPKLRIMRNNNKWINRIFRPLDVLLDAFLFCARNGNA